MCLVLEMQICSHGVLLNEVEAFTLKEMEMTSSFEKATRMVKSYSGQNSKVSTTSSRLSLNQQSSLLKALPFGMKHSDTPATSDQNTTKTERTFHPLRKTNATTALSRTFRRKHRKQQPSMRKSETSSYTLIFPANSQYALLEDPSITSPLSTTTQGIRQSNS